MPTLALLAEDAGPEALPPAERALKHPDGLLAAGGALTPRWLLHAYANGVFPWYSEGEPILWWSPDPRTVLVPAALRVSRSLGKTLRNGGFTLSCDRAFVEVIDACAAPRDEQSGTWITPAMREAYLNLHRLGHAHSVEVWREGQLAGGLYGVHLGRVFYGESMFSRQRDASKVALKQLVDLCQSRDIELIDCQVASPHLASLGAQSISRAQFLALLARLTALPAKPLPWT